MLRFKEIYLVEYPKKYRGSESIFKMFMKIAIFDQKQMIFNLYIISSTRNDYKSNCIWVVYKIWLEYNFILSSNHAKWLKIHDSINELSPNNCIGIVISLKFLVFLVLLVPIPK